MAIIRVCWLVFLIFILWVGMPVKGGSLIIIVATTLWLHPIKFKRLEENLDARHRIK